MITPQFKKAYKGLNKEQKKAVDFIEGPVMVIAGPGTGKTQILTLRIANILLKTHINPENILALTFSESASFEMRQRLSEIIGTPAFRVEISTFHSFANSIIHSYPDEFPYLLSSESITEVEQMELLEKLLNLLNLKLLKPFGDPLYYLKDILAAIGNLKKEGVVPGDLVNAISKQEKDFENIADLYHEKGQYGPKVRDDGVVTKGEMKGKYQELKKGIEKTEEFLNLFEAYQKALISEKKYDFNDMILEVIKAFETNKSLLLRIQEKYQYILIDEHQDTNAAQNKLIEKIAGFYKEPNLFVVGDANQAIYRFQGASLENFLYFQKLYKNAKLINLQNNYRSHQVILDASDSLIEKNISANLLPKKNLLAHTKLKEEKIKVVKLTNYQMEYEYVASDIAKKIKGGCDPADLAVLARRNADLDEMTKALKRKGIKSIIPADMDVISDHRIQKLIVILKSLNKPFDEINLIKAMHVDFLNIDPFDIYKLLNEAKKEKISFAHYLEKMKKGPLQVFYSKYKGWIKLNENIPFDDLFVKIINESGFLEHILKSDERYQVLTKLTAFFDEIKLQISKNSKYNLSDFLKLLKIAQKHKISLRAKNENFYEEGVKLLTVHKSKGKEFDFVYLINCFDGRWGKSRARGVRIKIPWEYLGSNIKTDLDLDMIEDERRLFYVALTRARKGIMLTFAKTGIEGREQLASQFLQEINTEFLEEIDVISFEKNFDRSVLFETPVAKAISPMDKKYLQNLFAQKQLSVTALENFMECPWKYFFRNLISLPDVKNKHLIFGTAMHTTLDAFIKVRNLKKPGLSFLINKFDEVLEKEAMSENDLLEIREKGKKALSLLSDNVLRLWPKDIISEMRIRGVRLSEGIVLGGRIDMIEPLSKDGAVRVHDFKTGKAKARAQIDGTKLDSKYNYFRQLVFYKILIERYKGGLFNMREGVIDFVEPDEKGRFRSEVFEVKDQDVRGLEELIKSTADQIINLKFWDTGCNEESCEYCSLRNMVF